VSRIIWRICTVGTLVELRNERGNVGIKNGAGSARRVIFGGWEAVGPTGKV
jgi:hypothetical protein